VATRKDPYLGVPVRAAASFRVLWAVRRRYRSGRIGAVVAGISWLLARGRTHLPAYSYLAVTQVELHILELEYGSTITVKRTVGHWPIGSLEAKTLDNPWSVRVCLGERTVDLEGVTNGPDAADVVRILTTD
jgi:hypothetical protein